MAETVTLPKAELRALARCAAIGMELAGYVLDEDTDEGDLPLMRMLSSDLFSIIAEHSR